MKLTELMIGDWVSCNGHPVLVEALNKSDGYAIEKDMISIKLNDNTCLGINAERLEPILITSNFLEKNEFVEINLDKEWTAKITGFDWVMHWCENYWIAVKQVRHNLWKIHIQGDSANLDGGVGYVHKLQHMLKSCEFGKEVIV